VVSFSDPVARRTAAGELVFPGHIGTIYQASNAAYLGRTVPRRLLLLPDGRVFSERALSKIRNDERGHAYAERELVRFGARPRRAGEGGAAWLRGALGAAGARQVVHGGNHRYAFRLGTWRRLVAVGLPAAAYPKAVAA
jgi:hypothetical protein